MPGEGNVIKLTLNNLTIPEGAAMSHGTYQKVSDTEYNLSITDKDNVTIDVIPAAGVTVASYTLSDTMSEFDSKTCEAAVEKLSFINPKLINTNDPDRNYVIGGKPATISFSLEDTPTGAHEAITLTLTNLTIPEGATTSGISSITGSGNVYQIVASSTNITIEAKPAVGENLKASYTLANDEFNEGAGKTDVPIQKLSFSNTEFIVNTTPADYLLTGDATSQIKFTMDQLPDDHNVTLWIKNASVNGLTPGTAVNGYTPYLIEVTQKTVTLGITVDSDVTDTNPQVGFYLRDPEFSDSITPVKSIRTRYTIDWSKVLIKTDNPNAAATSQAVNIYTDAACTKPAAVTSITTNSSGYATSSTNNVDEVPGSETYYFRFTRNGSTYTSEGVTLAQLAGGTTVICYKPTQHTIQSKKLRVYNGNNSTPQNGGSITWRLSDGTSGSVTLTENNGNASKRGYNNSAFSITCTSNEIITITSSTIGYSGQFKIADLDKGGTLAEIILTN